MWNEIIDNDTLLSFMEEMGFFHDSCIKELKYSSGAYVADDSAMILKDDCIYWCDCGDVSEADLEDYDGTLICASKLRWRAISGCMGQKEFYQSIK